LVARPQRDAKPSVNYPTYDPNSALTPLTAEELAAVEALLQRLPADAAMSLDGMDGYLTALAIGPAALRALPTAEWLPLIWGGDAEPGEAEGAMPATPFGTKRERKNMVVWALRHLRALDAQLHAHPDQWEPIFSIAEQGETEWVDAREWCMGFLQAVDVLPQAWGPVWSQAEVAPLLLLGGGLEGVSVPEAQALDLDDPQRCDQLSRQAPEAVLHLLAQQAA
jgi:uncharacterized protein